MTVTPQGDACRRPVPADAPDQAAQMAADLLARGRLAGTQDDRHRAAGGGVVDVDRQETALVVMGVEQRKLLMAVNHVDRIVDIEGHGFGRHGIARTVQINQDAHQPDQFAQARRVLQRDTVGCEHRSRPLSGSRSQASLNAGSRRSRSRSSASSKPQAIARMRARRMSGRRWTTRSGLRRSAILAASFAQIPRRRSAAANSMTPPSEVIRPPSKAAVTFLRATAGSLDAAALCGRRPQRFSRQFAPFPVPRASGCRPCPRVARGQPLSRSPLGSHLRGNDGFICSQTASGKWVAQTKTERPQPLRSSQAQWLGITSTDRPRSNCECCAPNRG